MRKFILSVDLMMTCLFPQVDFHPGPRLSKLLKFGPSLSASLKTEYSALECAIEIVDDVDEAVEHINKYSSHHTDTIVTNNGQWLPCTCLGPVCVLLICVCVCVCVRGGWEEEEGGGCKCVHIESFVQQKTKKMHCVKAIHYYCYYCFILQCRKVMYMWNFFKCVRYDIDTIV